MTKEERMVIDAAMKWCADFMNNGWPCDAHCYSLYKACLDHMSATFSDERKKSRRAVRKTVAPVKRRVKA